MLATRLRVLGFRNLRRQELELGAGITLAHGPNGAGKTNLLEAVFTALTGRSFRTRREREAIAFGESLARVEVEVTAGEERRTILWSLARDGERRHLLDGSPAAGGLSAQRPALSVFLPDRLGLIKGAPAGRRAHVDRLVAALWPARAEARARYGRALTQRNALLGRVRRGIAPGASLEAWDHELATAGAEVMAARADAVAALAPEFADAARELGLEGVASLRYVPRSAAESAAELAAELGERRRADVERGYSGHGPHLDEVEVALGGRTMRRYGSQGEQRSAMLSLLFAERRALLDARRAMPLMLLDDVMSELDPGRRELLANRLAEGDGQILITATEADQLPPGPQRAEVAVRGGVAEPTSADARAEVDPRPALAR